MARKLGLLIASIAAFAFVVPAAASALPALTTPPSSLVAKGTKIVTTSSDLQVKTSSGTVKCGSIETEWEVTENTGSFVRLAGSGEGNGSGCTLGEEAVPITDITPTVLSSWIQGKGGIALSFDLDLPGSTCHFLATPTFTYPEVQGDQITVPSQKLQATPESCGPAEIEGHFTLEKTKVAGGGAVNLGKPGSALTVSPGVLAPIGVGLNLTSTNMKIQTGFGNVFCEDTAIGAELTKNTGLIVGGIGLGKGITTGCFGAGTPQVTDLTLQSFESPFKGEGTMTMTFEVDLFGISCHFKSKAGGVKFTYESGSDKVSIASQSLTVVPAGCGSGVLSADFTLETSKKEPILD